MYISDKCVFTPYGSNFDLDEKLDTIIYDVYHNNKYSTNINQWLKDHSNYGLDEVYRINIKNSNLDSKLDLDLVNTYIANQGYGLDELINNKYVSVREAIARQGYGLDILINDEASSVRKVVASQGYGLDILINDKDKEVRKAIAEQGYSLDKLITDDSVEVRIAIAKQSYGLDTLINDKEYEVRRAVARQGYGLDTLINDKKYEVRSAVASQGYGLDILINDEYHYVREAVAEQGYGLDKLINDDNSDVRYEVKNYLTNNNMSLLQWYNNNLDRHYYDSFHDTVVESFSELYINQLLQDKIYLDWILKNTDHKSEVRKIIIDLGYNNIPDWIKNYPDNVYYKELLPEQLQKSSVTSKKKSKKTVKNKDLTSDQTKISESEKVTQDFVVKINDSKTLSVNESIIEDFFNSDDTNTELIIATVDTKLPIIKINKVHKDDNILYKFIVDITTENDDNFSIKSTIESKDQLNKLIEQTIDALQNYPQFIKYVDDLNNCL